MSLVIQKITKGIFWFSDSTHYDAYRAILLDPVNLPVTFDEWRKETNDVIQDLEESGITVIKAYIEHPGAFIEWCALNRCDVDTMACRKFANRRAAMQLFK